MLFRIGPGSSGYNYQPEFIVWDCGVLLQPAAVLTTGQVVMRDVTQFPGFVPVPPGTALPVPPSIADACVLPTSANAGPCYGVYQGPPITNTGAAAAYYVVPVLIRGWGQVSCNAPTVAVTVGGFLGQILTQLPATDTATPAALGTFVGFALATGAVTAKGATIIVISGATALVNTAIQIE